jgi:hypothetical protein
MTVVLVLFVIFLLIDACGLLQGIRHLLKCQTKKEREGYFNDLKVFGYIGIFEVIAFVVCLVFKGKITWITLAYDILSILMIGSLIMAMLIINGDCISDDRFN